MCLLICVSFYGSTIITFDYYYLIKFWKQHYVLLISNSWLLVFWTNIPVAFIFLIIFFTFHWYAKIKFCKSKLNMEMFLFFLFFFEKPLFVFINNERCIIEIWPLAYRILHFVVYTKAQCLWKVGVLNIYLTDFLFVWLNSISFL